MHEYILLITVMFGPSNIGKCEILIVFLATSHHYMLSLSIFYWPVRAEDFPIHKLLSIECFCTCVEIWKYSSTLPFQLSWLSNKSYFGFYATGFFLTLTSLLWYWLISNLWHILKFTVTFLAYMYMYVNGSNNIHTCPINGQVKY